MKFKYIALIIFLVLIVAGAIGGFLYYQNNKDLQNEVYRLTYPSACDEPIGYRIGQIDEEFEITNDKFREFTTKAADIWSREYGEKLFTEDPSSNLTVNLVFDERQKLTNEINSRSSEINNVEGDLKPNINEHQRQIAEFEKRMAAFNEKVKYWNERGGAPEEDYNKLVSEQAELKKQAESLNARADELNQTANTFNAKVLDFNDTVSEFNSTLKNKPEEGLFDGGKNTITIYFYVNDEELVHTLAHEFGHALGIKHVSDPNALMFTKTNKTVGLTRQDREQLTLACQRTPVWEILRDRYFE